MKKNILVTCAALAAAVTSTSFAVTPASRDAGVFEFGVVEADLSGWHMAGYAGISTRSAEKDSGTIDEIDMERYNVVLGYDFARWMTVYGLVGMQQAKSDSFMENDSAPVFGAGVWVNLIESDQLARLATVTGYRLSSGIEYSYSSFDDFTWSQVDAFLTFELKNEVRRVPFIFPEEFGLYFGPVVSYVISDEYENSNGNTIGMTVGVDMNFTDDTYLTIAGDFYSDNNSFYTMLGVRF